MHFGHFQFQYVLFLFDFRIFSCEQTNSYEQLSESVVGVRLSESALSAVASKLSNLLQVPGVVIMASLTIEVVNAEYAVVLLKVVGLVAVDRR